MTLCSIIKKAKKDHRALAIWILGKNDLSLLEKGNFFECIIREK